MLPKRLVKTAGWARTGALFFSLIMAAALSPLIQAEESAGHRLAVQISPVLRLDTDSVELVFDPDQTMEYAKIRILSNQKGRWQLSIKKENSWKFPSARIQWSLNGEDWSELTPLPSPLLSGGHTAGWKEIEVCFRLCIAEGEYEVARTTVYHAQIAYDLTVF